MISILAFTVLASSTPSTPAPLTRAEDGREVVGFHDAYWDTLDGEGRLTGGRFEVYLRQRRSEAGRIPAPVTTLTQTVLPPNSANRIDLVIVGDGYQVGQLPTYATHAATIANNFFNKEPYLTYQPLFLVHRVDVVSVDSGVDNDPTNGVQKNTAMDMGYWCNGIQRALCVEPVLAFQYANNAPDVDLVLAIANSTTYGGVGYSSLDLATSAGANSAAIEIVRHEFGHALGNLADEYDYADGTTYTGGEPAQADASKLTSAQMAADSKKWFRWLGVNNPAFDGLVSTFEGAIYCQFGVYRPTNNSLMRNLNRPFNLPSAEQVILQIYHIVKPIDDASPTGTIYAGTETLFVTPVTPTGNPLAIQWYRDGVAIPGATGSTLDLSTLAFGACPSTVSVTVRDTTAWVRDEAARAQWMTESRMYTVATAGTGFSNVCVTTPNSAGPGAVMDHVGTNSLAANDMELVTYGCPPNKTGIYFFGASQAQAPLGNGVRCVAAPFKRFPAIQTNALGDANLQLDFGDLPGGVVLQNGDVRYFQLWFRDPPGGGALTDTSDALRVQFCP